MTLSEQPFHQLVNILYHEGFALCGQVDLCGTTQSFFGQSRYHLLDWVLKSRLCLSPVLDLRDIAVFTS